MEYIYYRNKSTGKIEAKFVGCDTGSLLFRDESKYERFASSEDMPLEVSPAKETPTAPKTLQLSSPDGAVWSIGVDNTGKISTQKAAVQA